LDVSGSSSPDNRAQSYDRPDAMEAELATAARVLMSQKPIHNPAKEPLPTFADGWLKRCNHGDDVCHWHSSQLA